MSVTIATRIFFFPELLEPPPLLELSSEPQAATPASPPASRAKSIQRIRVCFTCSLLRAPGPGPGSLDQCEQPPPHVLLDEGRPQRGARDLSQRLLAEAEVVRGDLVLAADRGMPVRRVVRAERDRHAGGPQRGQRVGVVAGIQAERDVARRAHLEHRAARGQLAHQLRILGGADAVAYAGDAEGEALADALGTVPLPGVDGEAEPGVARDREGARELAGGVVGLVAAHAEARHVGVRPLDRATGDLARLRRTEMADAAHHDPRLDPGLRACVVDSLRQRGEVLLVGQPDTGGVVGRRGELDVDRALLRAGDEVLVDDVAVVLARADDARRGVVGGEEVEEVAPAEAAVVVEDAVGHTDVVARGDAADQLRAGRALDVDVELGLGDRHAAVGRCSNGSWLKRTLWTATT